MDYRRVLVSPGLGRARWVKQRTRRGECIELGKLRSGGLLREDGHDGGGEVGPLSGERVVGQNLCGLLDGEAVGLKVQPLRGDELDVPEAARHGQQVGAVGRRLVALHPDVAQRGQLQHGAGNGSLAEAAAAQLQLLQVGTAAGEGQQPLVRLPNVAQQHVPDVVAKLPDVPQPRVRETALAQVQREPAQRGAAAEQGAHAVVQGQVRDALLAVQQHHPEVAQFLAEGAQ